MNTIGEGCFHDPQTPDVMMNPYRIREKLFGFLCQTAGIKKIPVSNPAKESI